MKNEKMTHPVPDIMGTNAAPPPSFCVRKGKPPAAISAAL